VLSPIVLAIILRSDQWRDLGRRTNPSSLAPANLTAACLSLELAEKLNNYLNIYRIDKSSEPPACRGSKIRQMRSMPSKDAALWHKSGVKRVAASSFPDHHCGKALWKKKDSLSATDCTSLPSSAASVTATRSFFAENIRLPAKIGMAGRLLLIGLSYAHSCVLPRLAEQGVCSEIRTDYRISSDSHFAVANW